ncbi:MAG: class I SAM-dependent methyltransferase [Anaerolineales bacterium]
MKLSEYETMFRVEDGLWWYAGMRAITRAVVEQFYPRGGQLRILDAGCGTGANMSCLSDYGTVTGIDLVRYALSFARQRGHQPLCAASVKALPFASCTFDLVASLDVLPMLPADIETRALAEMARLLAPNGRLVLRAAAYDWLRGAHDRFWDVQHRYAPKELRWKLSQAGLVVEHLSFANMWLFPLAALKRLSERFFAEQAESDLALSAGALNRLLTSILSREGPWVARHSLPFGLSLMAVARKS